MLITFVKSIQVEAFRTDGTSWTTRIDAAYGHFDSGAGLLEGMVNFKLYEGVANSRDGGVSKFGLNKLLPATADLLRGPKCEARDKLLDDWSSDPPQGRWQSVKVAIKVDNIRSVVSA